MQGRTDRSKLSGQPPSLAFAEKMTVDDEHIPFAMWQSAILIAMQSFLFGYVFSSLNACLVTGDNTDTKECFDGTDSTCPAGTIYNDINLSTIEASLATGLTVLGAWIGCMIGNKPSELKGRKFTLLANNVFFVSGAVFSAIGTLETLFVGRFLSGLGVGIASVLPPVLLSEIATASTRGTITTLHQLMLTLGIFFVSLLGYGLVTYVDHGWQYIQAFAAIPALISLCFFAYIPESPKWILAQEPEPHAHNAHHEHVANPLTTDVNGHFVSPQREPARQVLVHLRPVGHDVDAEIDSILAEAKANEAESDDQVTYWDVLACKPAVIIGCGLGFFVSSTGINSVMFYSTTIFELAGFSQSIIGTTVMGLLNFFMTVLSAYLIDKMGRRVLLLSGTYVMLIGLVLLSVILLCPVPDTAQGAIAVIAVLIYVAGFAVGFGAVVWTIMAEIMPTRLRMKAMSLFLAMKWASDLAISMLTLVAIDGLGGVHGGMDDDAEANAEKRGVAILYLLFGGLVAASIIFIHLLVPETKGKSPEDFMHPAHKPLLADEDKRHF